MSCCATGAQVGGNARREGKAAREGTWALCDGTRWDNRLHCGQQGVFVLVHVLYFSPPAFKKGLIQVGCASSWRVRTSRSRACMMYWETCNRSTWSIGSRSSLHSRLTISTYGCSLASPPTAPQELLLLPDLYHSYLT